MFEVVPQLPPFTAPEAVDFEFLVYIYVNTTPVFVATINPHDDFRFSRKRLEADLQLWRSFLDMDSPGMNIPILHDLSVFGTKIAFYRYDKQTGAMI